MLFLGTDYTAKFNPIEDHGVENTMSTLNSALKHLFNRLTFGMAPDDQVRLIMSSKTIFGHGSSNAAIQAYDGYFILQYLYKQGIRPQIITRSGKILSLKVAELDIKYIDSSCFIPMKLAEFPKTFGRTEA